MRRAMVPHGLVGIVSGHAVLKLDTIPEGGTKLNSPGAQGASSFVALAGRGRGGGRWVGRPFVVHGAGNGPFRHDHRRPNCHSASGQNAPRVERQGDPAS